MAPSLLTLPQEILDQILDNVVTTHLPAPSMEHLKPTNPALMSSLTPTYTNPTPQLTTRVTAMPTLVANKKLHFCTTAALARLTQHQPTALELDMILTWEGHWLPTWTYFPDPNLRDVDELKVTVRYAGGCGRHRHLSLCLQGPNDAMCERGRSFERETMVEFVKVLYEVLRYGKLKFGGGNGGEEKDEDEGVDTGEGGLLVQNVIIDIQTFQPEKPVALPASATWGREVYAMRCKELIERSYLDPLFAISYDAQDIVDFGSGRTKVLSLMERLGTTEIWVNGELRADETSLHWDGKSVRDGVEDALANWDEEWWPMFWMGCGDWKEEMRGLLGRRLERGFMDGGVYEWEMQRVEDLAEGEVFEF